MAEDGAFGVLLRRLRLAADLTLEQLAEASGVTDRAISDMERGVSRSPRVRTVEAVADGLNLTADERAALFTAARSSRRPAAPTAPGGLPLPRPTADFTGRASELAQVTAWMADAREDTPAPVAVISGTPGVGKTSLAVRAARSWPAEEHLFLDLRGLDARPLSPATVLGRLIRAVSAEQPAPTVPRDVDEAAALWQTLIRGRRFVVVLDNAVTESQVRPVLPPFGSTAVLVTSRRALSGLEGVRRLRLGALPDDDAVRLLAAILDQKAAGEPSLRRIAELCVNVPLALRIAGHRLLSRPGWTPDDLVARLAAEEQRLDALTAGDLEIKAAFTLSYQQLSPPARRVFRRLALVPGPSTGVGLAAVLAGESGPVTEQALDELVEVSLLDQRPDGRLEFHDLLRLYAGLELDREEDAATRAEAIRRRDAWLLDTVVRAGRFFEPEALPAEPGPGADLRSEAQAGQWLRREAENWLPALRQAAREGDDRRVVEVAESLHWFSDGWPTWPHWATVFTLADRAAERLGDDRLRAVHLGYLAWVDIVGLNQPDTALEHARHALACAERSGDERQIGWANYYVGWALSRKQQWTEAAGHARVAAARFRATGDREGRPNALLLEGLAVRTIGPPDDAIPLFEEAVAAVTDPATAPPEHIATFIEAVARSSLTAIEIDAQRWERALDRVTPSIAVAERLDHPSHQLLTALSQRAQVYARLGDTTKAVDDLRTVRDLLARLGVRAPDSPALHNRLAEVERLTGT